MRGFSLSPFLPSCLGDELRACFCVSPAFCAPRSFSIIRGPTQACACSINPPDFLRPYACASFHSRWPCTCAPLPTGFLCFPTLLLPHYFPFTDTLTCLFPPPHFFGDFFFFWLLTLLSLFPHSIRGHPRTSPVYGTLFGEIG